MSYIEKTKGMAETKERYICRPGCHTHWWRQQSCTCLSCLRAPRTWPSPSTSSLTSFEKLCQEEKYLMIGINMKIDLYYGRDHWSMTTIFEKSFLHGTNYNGTLSTVRFIPFPINMIKGKIIHLPWIFLHRDEWAWSAVLMNFKQSLRLTKLSISVHLQCSGGTHHLPVRHNHRC